MAIASLIFGIASIVSALTTQAFPVPITPFLNILASIPMGILLPNFLLAEEGGFILSFILGILGLILGFISKKDVKNYNTSMWGIKVSVVGLVLTVIVVVILCFMNQSSLGY